MDTGTIIITSILILSCILPFIMMNTQRRKKDKQLLQALQKLATNNQTLSAISI
jgi:preprotein translocase subunit YajC